MKTWRQRFPVEVMGRLFRVSRGGFYDWPTRGPSARAQEDERLKVAIRAAHGRSRETCGDRRLQPELATGGFVAGRDRIGRLRRGMGLRCRQKRRFKATTNSSHNLPVAGNLPGQQFSPTAPDQVWVTDLACIPTGEGWLCLAGIKDVFTCEIAGHAVGERRTQEPTALALVRAVRLKRPPAGRIHHSGLGSRYCAHDYRALVAQFGLRASMSRKDNCYGNAPMESFWGSLRNGLVHHRRFATRAGAKAAIQECTGIFYSRQRRHSRPGNLPPAVFAQRFSRLAAAA